ncbi:DUF2812 domain-containing protein [Solibacillus sp. FSL W7-1324]|uniref:DUF2812 domain-containing protein n=1 Tax=Solibacillus sp. FSL W7-1324 TaxID=2921701 RepID=UPI0030F8E3EE
MAEIVRRLRPGQYWRIKEHESWFSDMSEQGLHFYEIGTHFAKFKKGDRKRMDYRLELAKNKYISNEKIRLFEESGWDYIASDRNFHVFAAPTDRKVKESPINREEQLSIASALFKKTLMSFIIILLAVIALFWLISSIWFTGNTPTLTLIEGHIFTTMVLSLLNLYYLISMAMGLIGIARIRRDMNEENYDNHHKPWEIFYRNNIIMYVMTMAISLIAIFIPFYQLLQMDTLTLPEEDSSLPFVRLATIENAPNLERDVFMIDEVDWGNNYSENWSIVAPVQFSTRENFIEKKGQWSDPNNSYEPSISSEVYRLNFKSLVAPLVDDLITKYSYVNEAESFIEKEHKEFDRLLVRLGDNNKEFIFVKDQAVMYIDYSGKVGADVIIENAAEKMDLLTEY